MSNFQPPYAKYQDFINRVHQDAFGLGASVQNPDSMYKTYPNESSSHSTLKKSSCPVRAYDLWTPRWHGFLQNPANNQSLPSSVSSSLDATVADHSQPTLATVLNINPENLQPFDNPPLYEMEASSDTESDCDMSDATHPNKFPTEIESHKSRYCTYQRQKTRSGEKEKVKLVTHYNPLTGKAEPEQIIQRYYQKHLVRMCKCGKYDAMDGALKSGRTNDCAGYEIHYSQKCRWKKYTDAKTGESVLIRLCKCYKPS